MIGEAEVSKVLRGKGIYCNGPWVVQAIAHLRNQGPVGASVEAVAEKVFNLYLYSDIYDSSDYGQGGNPGMLPANVRSMHKEVLAKDQAIVLQVDEVTNIGSSLDQQGQEANRYLKLFLTDGENFVVGLEHKRVNDLRLNLPAGTKVCIKNASIRHGALLLSNSSFKVLGGEVGRLMDLAKLYAPPEEEQQPHILDEKQPVGGGQSTGGALPMQQQQQHIPREAPRQQQQQQQPPRKPLEVREPPPAVAGPAAPRGAVSPAANLKPAPAALGTPEQDSAFPYPDAIDLLDDSQGSENFPAQHPAPRGSPQIYDLTGSGPSSGVKDASIVLDDEPMDVDNYDGVEAVPFPAVGDTEEDDLLGTPPGPAASASGAKADKVPSMMRGVPLPVISPLSRLAEECGLSQEDKEVYIRGHGTSMEKFKVRKAKGDNDKDKDKSQSPLKSQDQLEFEVRLHFDDGSTVYKMLRVHPALCEKQIGISARVYQETLDKLDEKGASEYKRSVQMKFATFRGIFRCEWKKSRKKKKKGSPPDSLELEAVEQVEDPIIVKALAQAMLKAQDG